jgi:hypothetical protein
VARFSAGSRVPYHSVSRATPLKRGSVRRLTVSRKEHLRVVVEVAGERRDMLTIRVANDNSFFVFPHRPEGQPWRFPTLVDDEHGRTVDFNAYVEPALSLQKLTIHRSGFLHASDFSSRRYRDGLRVPPFVDMPLPFEACLFAPCDPISLPVSTPTKGDVLTVQFDPQQPFIVRLHVAESATPRPTAQSKIFMFGNLRFGLCITCETVPNATPDVPVPWPPYPFFALPAV